MAKSKKEQLILHGEILQGFTEDVLFSWTVKKEWKNQQGGILSRRHMQDSEVRGRGGWKVC